MKVGVTWEISMIFKIVLHIHSLHETLRIVPTPALQSWPHHIHFGTREGVNNIHKYVKSTRGESLKCFVDQLDFYSVYILWFPASEAWSQNRILKSFCKRLFSECLLLAHKAGEGRWGTDELAFTEVLAKRSHKQLRATFLAYQIVSKQVLG